MTKWLLAGLFVILALSQWHFWFDENGLLNVIDTKKQLAQIQQINEQKKLENKRLVLEINHLSKNYDMIEAEARLKFGLIKKDEQFYQIIPNS